MHIQRLLGKIRIKSHLTRSQVKISESREVNKKEFFTPKELFDLKIRFDLKIYIISKYLSDKQALAVAVKCSEMCLAGWEQEFPRDNRPRLVIEAKKAYLNNSSEVNRLRLIIAQSKASHCIDLATTRAAYFAAYCAPSTDAYDCLYRANEALCNEEQEQMIKFILSLNIRTSLFFRIIKNMIKN